MKKHYKLLITMCSAALFFFTPLTLKAQVVTLTGGSEEDRIVDFSTATGSNRITEFTGSDATTMIVTGNWTVGQLAGLRNVLHTTNEYLSTNIQPIILTLRTADLSGMRVIDDSNTYNGFTSLFTNYTSLETVTFPDEEIHTQVCLNVIFYGCLALTNVNNLDHLTNVTAFWMAFSSCSLLESITLPEGTSYANPTDFSDAFSSCSKLKEVVNLDKFTNISSFYRTFVHCPSLESLTLPEGTEYTNAISFSNAFYGCSSLKELTNFDKFTNLGDLSNAFVSCSLLESLTLPISTISGSPVSFANAFVSCSNLKAINNLDQFTTISDLSSAFMNCYALEQVTLPQGTNALSISFNNTFSYCRNLRAINNLDQFTTISDLTSAFYNCSSLPSITFSPVTNNLPVSMSETFSGCTSLREINNLYSFTTITDLSATFGNCRSLVAISISSIGGAASNTFQDANPNMLKYLPEAVVSVPTEWRLTTILYRQLAEYLLPMAI